MSFTRWSINALLDCVFHLDWMCSEIFGRIYLFRINWSNSFNFHHGDLTFLFFWIIRGAKFLRTTDCIPHLLLTIRRNFRTSMLLSYFKVWPKYLTNQNHNKRNLQPFSLFSNPMDVFAGFLKDSLVISNFKRDTYAPHVIDYNTYVSFYCQSYGYYLTLI